MPASSNSPRKPDYRGHWPVLPIFLGKRTELLAISRFSSIDSLFPTASHNLSRDSLILQEMKSIGVLHEAELELAQVPVGMPWLCLRV